MSEVEIRADERRKCVEEIRAMNAENSGHEWVRGSLWQKIIERAAGAIEAKPSTKGEPHG